MILKVIGGKNAVMLFGSKMTEKELKSLIKFAEQIAEPLKEDLVVTLERLYDWEPVQSWDYVDYTYDCKKKELKAVEKEEPEEAEKKE